MTAYRCDMWGRELPADPCGRFVVRIETFAADGPLEITDEDLQKDLEAEIRRIVEQLSRTPLEAIEDEVYRAFRFDLCPACHARYLRDPLGRRASSQGTDAQESCG